MHVPSQTALRNRRIVWGHSAHRVGGDQLSRAVPAAADRSADGRDPGHHHRCSCSDHCSGVADSPSCNGHPDADGGADATPFDNRTPDAYNAATVTYLNAGARCCGDPGDCQPDAACRAATNRTA